MQSSTFSKVKRFLKRVNPFSRHNFHVSKIRHGRLDYLTHFLLHKHTGKVATSLLSVTTVALLLTSFTFANAAPTSEPPTSNVSPNFNGVNIDSQDGTKSAQINVNKNNAQNVPIARIYSQYNANESSLIQLSAGLVTLSSTSGGLTSFIDFFNNQIRIESDKLIRISGPELRLDANKIHSAGTFVLGNNTETGASGYFQVGYSYMGTLYRSDNQTLTRSVYCPIGKDSISNGTVVSCGYNITGNPYSIVSTSKMSDTNSRYCNYSITGNVLSQSYRNSYGETTTVRAQPLCFYGGTY